MGCCVTELFIFTKIKRAKTQNNIDNKERKGEVIGQNGEQRKCMICACVQNSTSITIKA